LTQKFAELIQTLDKIGKTCVVHLTPKKVEFILTSDITDGVQVWSGVNAVRTMTCLIQTFRFFLIASLQATLFDDYRIESKNNNEIAFELSLDNVLRGLKSGIYLLFILFYY
jgi:hypothetical protein